VPSCLVCDQYFTLIAQRSDHLFKKISDDRRVVAADTKDVFKGRRAIVGDGVEYEPRQLLMKGLSRKILGMLVKHIIKSHLLDSFTWGKAQGVEPRAAMMHRRVVFGPVDHPDFIAGFPVFGQVDRLLPIFQSY